MASAQHFSFKCFPENSFVSEIFQKSSGLFWYAALSVNGLKHTHILSAASCDYKKSPVLWRGIITT